MCIYLFVYFSAILRRVCLCVLENPQSANDMGKIREKLFKLTKLEGSDARMMYGILHTC